ncbi:MAG: HAD family hydrolase [Solirubrobacteraceae bacterium]
MAFARDRLTDRLGAVLAANPERFREIPGAGEAIRRATAEGWSIAVATGCWGPSARLKLRAAGFRVADAVLACADDAMARADIVALAKARAEAHYGRAFSRIVSIGDGVWDVGAAAALELPFIGIGSGAQAVELSSAGAATVMSDYSDAGEFLRALDAAQPPRLAAAPAPPS